MSDILLTTIDILYYAIFVLIFARIILSWVRVGSYEIRDLIFRITEPLLAPIRRLMPAGAGLDFSPMIVLILAAVIRQLLQSALR